MYGYDDDEDLMSIVRSCSRGKGKAITPTPPPTIIPPPLPPPFPTRMEERLPTIFPDLFLTNQATSFIGLEEICMPFLPQPLQQQRLQQPCNFLPTITSMAGSSKQASTRTKKRKNHQKKVVTQVPVDNSISNDYWAWRKYGQKPIKGSPYPRGYYRCSTAKSCPARKQVEKSPVDPGMLIVTYTDEHNHPLPTKRISLAGVARNKYSGGGRRKAADAEGSSSGLSPTTPLTASPSVEEEDDDEGMALEIEDMEVVGDGELVFIGGASAPKRPAAVPYFSSFFDGVEDPFFSKIWNGSNGANKLA